MRAPIEAGTTMRVLGIDHGGVRIGLALSDPTGTLATPLGVLERRRRLRQDLRRIAAIVQQRDVELVVVGLPLEMDGTEGKKAREVRQFVAALREVVGVPVVAWDERLTTVEAHARLREGGHRRRGRAARADQAAAAIVLQAYLDARRAGTVPDPAAGGTEAEPRSGTVS